MTDKLDKAEAWLLKQNPQYMPTMANFRKRFDLNYEELGAIVSRNNRMNVRMDVEQEETPLPEPKPTYSMAEVFERMPPASLKETQALRVEAELRNIVAELGDLMNRSGINDCYLDVPHNLSKLSCSESPDFTARLHVERVGNRYKFELTGEWDLNKQD